VNWQTASKESVIRSIKDDSFNLLKSTKKMYQRIAHIALVVKDYDEAIEFYTNKLDFTLLEDTEIDEKKRWVIIAPPGAKECSLLLAKAADERQTNSIGNQAGGRVGFFLFTDNFWRDYKKLTEKEVPFVRPPTEFEYGTVAVFEDLYGNMWDLIEPNKNNKGFIR
jgi:catechol 2,3-dioxygenase-like lactoylglutathione lyase family enzyme